MSNDIVPVPQDSPLSSRPPNVAAVVASSITDMWWMAERIAETKMFPGLNTPSHVFTLMLICQSEGLQPIEALRRFDVIEGKPAMKSAAIQAEFQKRGGRIKILRRDEVEARAIFVHPLLCPDGWENVVTFEELDRRGVTRGKGGIKANYERHRPEMLWARLVSTSINAIDPGIRVGIPSSEELRDEIDVEFKTAPTVSQTATVANADGSPVNVAEPRLPGQDSPGADSRTYGESVRSAVEATNTKIAELVDTEHGEVPPLEISIADTHKMLMNALIQANYHPGPMPSQQKDFAIALTKSYKVHRDWMRRTLIEYLKGQYELAEATVGQKPAQSAPEHASQDNIDDGLEGVEDIDPAKKEEPVKEPVKPEEPKAQDPPQTPRGRRGHQQTILPREPGSDDNLE